MASVKSHNLLERNARTGIAMEMVADILVRDRRTDGNILIISSFISREQIRKVVTQILAHFETRPNSRHFTRSRCASQKLNELKKKHLKIKKKLNLIPSLDS